jgi:hypothetical protein
MESHHTSVNVTPSYIDCNDMSTSYFQDWSEFDCSSAQDTGIAPYLLTHTSSELSEQTTQYSISTPTELSWNCASKSPIVEKQLGDDIPWPVQRSDSVQWQQKLSLDHRATQQQDVGIHSAKGQLVTDPIGVNADAPQVFAHPQSAQRKRGRPRLYGNRSPSQLFAAHKSHLEKNRIAATKCRERSKQQTAELVAQSSELSSKNKALKADETALREELLELKNEVLRHAGCGSWAIDEYVSQCAGNILGVKAPSAQTPVSRRDSAQTQKLDVSARLTDNFACQTVSESPNDQGNMASSSESDDYESLRLFNIHWDMDRQQSWDFQNP